MSYEAECYAWDKPVLGRKIDKALAENAKLLDLLKEIGVQQASFNLNPQTRAKLVAALKELDP